MKRVTGIGGIFFKAEDPDKLKKWYGTHLGLTITEWGSTFKWSDADNPNVGEGRTEWSPFKNDTDYFSPSSKQFMINYRVEDLAALMEALRNEGVSIVGDMQEYSYGKFAWIMDPEGNKIELYEPAGE